MSREVRHMSVHSAAVYAETGVCMSPGAPDQPGQHSETLSPCPKNVVKGSDILATEEQYK